jgi:hypothetical protein
LSLGLTGHYVGTIVGEETISAICFCWIEGVEATMVAMVAVAFYASFEPVLKKSPKNRDFFKKSRFFLLHEKLAHRNQDFFSFEKVETFSKSRRSFEKVVAN